MNKPAIDEEKGSDVIHHLQGVRGRQGVLCSPFCQVVLVYRLILVLQVTPSALLGPIGLKCQT